MKTNGKTIYTGQSMLDGQPIKAIATGTAKASDNAKTGDMLQLWIMPTTSKPTEAVKNGADSSVCGVCPHRPSVAKSWGYKECYVNVGQAPNAVYRTTYPETGNTRAVPVRLGAWGEPTAIPFDVLSPLTANGHTGYTHTWRDCDIRYQDILMASVDSPEEQAQAVAAGWRTFRCRTPEEPLLAGEISCPASKEAGYKSQCAKCLLCSGNTRKGAKNVAIIVH
jgi:hypothetical protein